MTLFNCMQMKLFWLFLSIFTATVDSAWPLASRTGGVLSPSNIYKRITPAPMVWTHLRKSSIKNVTVPKLEDLLAEAVAKNAQKQPNTQKQANALKQPSFLQADPLMIRNGLYLSRPLRTPSQAFVNAAVVENISGIEGEKLFKSEKAETRRLKTEFAKGLKELINKG